MDPNGGPIWREAMAVVRAMDTEAEFIEDPKAKMAFKAFIRASGNVTRLKAMIDNASRLKGVQVEGGLFDSKPENGPANGPWCSS